MLLIHEAVRRGNPVAQSDFLLSPCSKVTQLPRHFRRANSLRRLGIRIIQKFN